MTPAEIRTEQYHLASSATKMAVCFIGASNEGRNQSQINMAKKNLLLALEAVQKIELTNTP